MASASTLAAARYARALFDLAEQQGQHDEVSRDIEKIERMLAQNPGLSSMMKNPLITRKQALQAFGTLLGALGASALTQHFFATLATERRLPLANAAMAAYRTLLQEKRGQVVVHITSAQRLSEGQKTALADALAQATGKTPLLTTAENPALLGGVQIMLNGMLIDGSITGKLEHLRQTLKKAA